MRKCENCGANLGSGERCDCEMEGREKQKWSWRRCCAR